MNGGSRVVVALGGNALLKRGEPLTAAHQRENVRIAARRLAPLARRHSLVVTHGNGPQVGMLALQAEACAAVEPFPLDVLGAESEGMIGYVVEQEVASLLPGRALATVLTMVEVGPRDEAFANPREPIGPLYGELEAERLRVEAPWTLARDGEHWRRVVASPRPKRVLEIRAVEWLLEKGATVICESLGKIGGIDDVSSRLPAPGQVLDVLGIESVEHVVKALRDSQTTILRRLRWREGSPRSAEGNAAVDADFRARAESGRAVHLRSGIRRAESRVLPSSTENFLGRSMKALQGGSTLTTARTRRRIERELERVNEMIAAIKQEPRAQELEGLGDNTPLSEEVDSVVAAEARELGSDLLGRLLDRAAALDEALHRVQEGTYGACIDCGGRISGERLIAVPEALRCIACQEAFDTASGPREIHEHEWKLAEETSRERRRREGSEARALFGTSRPEE